MERKREARLIKEMEGPMEDLLDEACDLEKVVRVRTAVCTSAHIAPFSSSRPPLPPSIPPLRTLPPPAIHRHITTSRVRHAPLGTSRRHIPATAPKELTALAGERFKPKMFVLALEKKILLANGKEKIAIVGREGKRERGVPHREVL